MFPIIRRKPFHERGATTEEHESHRRQQRSSPSRLSNASNHSDGGEERWRDAAGDRLSDFGVDGEVEFYDEDDMPLAKVMEQHNIRRI